jgi:hypothetical protein
VHHEDERIDEAFAGFGGPGVDRVFEAAIAGEDVQADRSSRRRGRGRDGIRRGAAAREERGEQGEDRDVASLIVRGAEKVRGGSIAAIGRPLMSRKMMGGVGSPLLPMHHGQRITATAASGGSPTVRGACW